MKCVPQRWLPTIPHHTFTVNLHYLTWIAMQPRLHISCTGDTVMLQLSLYCEQTVIHKLQLSFQPSAKLYTAEIISWQKLLHFLDVVWPKTIIMQVFHTCDWSWSTSLHGNSAYTCMWDQLNGTKYTAFHIMLLLPMFCICSWEGTCLSQTSENTVNMFQYRTLQSGKGC